MPRSPAAAHPDTAPDTTPGPAPGTPTPVVPVLLRVAGRPRRVWLKLESHNPTGSIKYRTATGLLHDLGRRGRLAPGTELVESSSGNLAIALAWLSREHGYRLTAVTDPNTDPALVERLHGLGAHTLVVDRPDRNGNYLAARLEAVRGLVAADPGRVWTNQYARLANPAVHFHRTGPELHGQCPWMDAVFIAASTGGTLAGIGRHLRAADPRIRVVGVDVHGSRVFGGRAGRRVLPGIGASRRSAFLRPADYDDVLHVGEADIVAACHLLRDAAGIGVGASSGAVLVACGRYLADHPDVRRPVCVCPDGAENYRNTLADPAWLAAHADHLGDDPTDPGALPFSVEPRRRRRPATTRENP